MLLGGINQLARHLPVTASYRTCENECGRRYGTSETETEGSFNRSDRSSPTRTRVCSRVLRWLGNSVLWAYLSPRFLSTSNGKHITLESDKFALETGRKDARNSI